jgi:hypothetical protein
MPARSARRLLGSRPRLSGPDDPRRVGWETELIDAAAAVGVPRIVKLSGIGAAPNSPVGPWADTGRSSDTCWSPARRPSSCARASSYLLAGAQQVADAAELDRALTDPDPLRGIAPLTTRLGAAFTLDPAGVTRTKALGTERMARKLRDALPGARTTSGPPCGSSCARCSRPRSSSSTATRS